MHRFLLYDFCGVIPSEASNLLDTKRLWWVNVNCAEQVTRQLRECRKVIRVEPSRVDLPCGRKKNAGDREGMYFTYFGRDAAESLTRYFNEIRGWPSPGHAIWQKEDYDYDYL